MASTNRIIKALGISKGVLFKYFGDKAGLFISVCEYGISEYSDSFEIRPYNDVFECMKDLTGQKIRWLREHPLTYRLIMRIIKEPQHPVYAQVLELAAAVSQKQAKLFQSLLPIKGLRQGVSSEQVLSAIFWISQGLYDKYANAFPENVEDNYDAYYQRLGAEMDEYFNIIKYSIYGDDSSEKTTES